MIMYACIMLIILTYACILCIDIVDETEEQRDKRIRRDWRRKCAARKEASAHAFLISDVQIVLRRVISEVSKC